jgi:hypothetical protein
MNGLKIGAIALAMLAIGAAAARAEGATDVPDVIDAFDKYCFTAGADRNVTLNLIPDDGVNGKIIPPKQVEAEQGAPGGAAWYVRSPNKLLLEVQYTPNNICSVDVPKIDTAALFNAAKSFLATKAKGEGVRFIVKDDKKDDQGGLHQHRVFYMVNQPKAGTTGFMAISILDGGQLDEHRGQLSFILTSDPYSEEK